MSKLLLGGALGAGLLGYLAVKAKKGHAKRVFAPKTLGLTAPDRTKMVPVQSSMIKELGYRDKSGALVVKFNDGKTYRFKNVPRALFTKIMRAGSKGEAFNKMVKNKYEHEKVGAKQNPFDRITPPRPTKSLNDVLVDLRSLDTPEEWHAYVGRHHGQGEKARHSVEASRGNGRK